MADLVRDHVGAGELAGFAAAAAEAPLQVLEERRVEIDLVVARAIERPHRALRRAAGRARRAREHHELGRAIGLAVLGEHVLPLHLGAAEHAAHEARSLVVDRRRRRTRRLLLLLLAAAENLRAADQQPRIDAERLADDAEHHDGADAEPAASHREAASQPPPDPPPSPRRSSTLSLCGRSSQRMFDSPSPALGNSCRVFLVKLQSRLHRVTATITNPCKTIWFRSDLSGRPLRTVKSIFTVSGHPSRRRFVGPASPTASPESEF